jgi:ABC-2 type transport system permease protein
MDGMTPGDGTAEPTLAPPTTRAGTTNGATRADRATRSDTKDRTDRMTRSRRWVPVAVETAVRRVVAQPAALVVMVTFNVTVVAVLTGLWRVAADANGGEIAGYSAAALTWYIATSEAASVCLNIRLIEHAGNDIGSGRVASELLRPASVLGVRVASELGWVLPRLVVCVATGALVAAIGAGGPPRPAALVLAVPSLLLAVSCNVVAQYGFAAVAFWIRDAGSAWFLYLKFVFLLGGMLIPLEILPGWLASTAALLPFRSMAYIPARLASGHLQPWLLAEQAAWLVALTVATTALFRAGERRLQVVGG